jgi:hypothetical protein
MNHQVGKKWAMSALTGAALAMGSFTTMNAQAGVCVLDFADIPANYNPYPLYFNQNGWFDHGAPPFALAPIGLVARFLSCYQYKTKAWCQGQIGQFRDPPAADVTSAHWYDVDTCNDLRDDGVLPPKEEVELLAKGVELTATKNGNEVDLTLTTDAEPDTAALLILRGDKLENGGTKIDVACSFPSGGSPYTCTDDPAANTYRAAEVEYDGSLIIYDEVTPKK